MCAFLKSKAQVLMVYEGTAIGIAQVITDFYAEATCDVEA